MCTELTKASSKDFLKTKYSGWNCLPLCRKAVSAKSPVLFELIKLAGEHRLHQRGAHPPSWLQHTALEQGLWEQIR